MRSLAFGVPPDGPLELRYTGVPAADNALLRAARPVARELFAQLQGIDTAMLLTDADARVLARWCGEPGLSGHLDRVGAAPGFVFEECRAGTSALGSVLEEGAAVEVIGPEHFSERLQGLSAVGVPVVHPVSGRIEGVVDLVCPSARRSALMAALITRTAGDIAGRLLTGYAGRDRLLLDAFLRADRRGPRRPMLAINERMMIVNPQAAGVLGEADHGALWDRVGRALRDRRTDVVVAAGAAEAEAVHGVISEARDGGDRVGAVVHLRRRGRTAARDGRKPAATRVVQRLRERLPGASREWQLTLTRSSAVFAAGERLLLVGPGGAGKRALALAVCEVHGAGGDVAEHDASDALGRAVPGWLDRVTATPDRRPAALLLTHLERADRPTMSRLCRWLDHRPPTAPPVIGTYRPTGGAQVPPALLDQFPHVVAVPSLAARPQDVADIARAAALEPAPHEPVRLDADAVRLLVAADWPGNVRQLRRVVLAARAVCPGTVIRAGDVPEPLHVSARRMALTKLQRLEREAIVATLAATNGNKRAAAASLGVSRSTLYRKLAALGIAD